MTLNAFIGQMKYRWNKSLERGTVWVFRTASEKYNDDYVELELITTKSNEVIFWGTFRGKRKGAMVALVGDPGSKVKGVDSKVYSGASLGSLPP